MSNSSLIKNINYYVQDVRLRRLYTPRYIHTPCYNISKTSRLRLSWLLSASIFFYINVFNHLSYSNSVRNLSLVSKLRRGNRGSRGLRAVCDGFCFSSRDVYRRRRRNDFKKYVAARGSEIVFVRITNNNIYNDRSLGLSSIYRLTEKVIAENL